MRATMRQQIKGDETALQMADRNAREAWIKGDKAEQEKWMHWADRLEARIERLYSIANRGA